MAKEVKKDCILIETKNYPIYLGTSAYSGLSYMIESYLNDGVFVLVDDHTEEDCLPHLLRNIALLEEAILIRVPSGEPYKTLESCGYIWQELLRSNAGRNSLLINLGGGVISDMGGFAASTYKRGMDFINIPTTLMGQIDASIGGKTGVDFRNLKNQIGLFSDPKAVLVDLEFLKTLGKRAYLSGFAELIKYTLIQKDKAMREAVLHIEPGNQDQLMRLVEKAIRIKVDVAERDHFDLGERRKLNFGHTIGHAIESWSLTKESALNLLHGEAVAFGMICESFISYKRGYLTNEDLDWIVALISNWYKTVLFDAQDEIEILNLMKFDKKNRQGIINAVLIDAKGSCYFDQELSETEITSSFTYYRQFSEINSLST